MEINQLITVVKSALESLKAKDITVLDVQDFCSFTDVMVIASGNTRRQVTALAERVIEKVKESGYSPLGQEGERFGEWILVDLGTVVVHVMQPQVRDFYQLEKLWSDTGDSDKMSHSEGAIMSI